MRISWEFIGHGHGLIDLKNAKLEELTKRNTWKFAESKDNQDKGKGTQGTVSE